MTNDFFYIFKHANMTNMTDMTFDSLERKLLDDANAMAHAGRSHIRSFNTRLVDAPSKYHVLRLLGLLDYEVVQGEHDLFEYAKHILRNSIVKKATEQELRLLLKTDETETLFLGNSIEGLKNHLELVALAFNFKKPVEEKTILDICNAYANVCNSVSDDGELTDDAIRDNLKDLCVTFNSYL
jgi:hypothetical protein